MDRLIAASNENMSNQEPSRFVTNHEPSRFTNNQEPSRFPSNLEPSRLINSTSNQESPRLTHNPTNREASRFPSDMTNYSPANVRMVENVLLIWLDNNIDEVNNTDCANTLIQLRWIVNNTHVFTDEEKCVDFIYKIKHEKVCMIISGSLGQNIVPIVHGIPYIDSIFIFCGNKSLHETWVKKWPKIRGVHTAITPICETLYQIVQKYELGSIGIYYMNPEDSSWKSGAGQSVRTNFLLTKVLKELILKMEFDNAHLQQWVGFCRPSLTTNETDSKGLDLLEKKYPHIPPVWFYAHDYFIWSTLNRSLRTFDVNILVKMSFFIHDLHEQIDRLHREQMIQSGMNQPFTVYHGQGLLKPVAEQMTKSKSGLIIFNSFLCASTDRRLAHDLANRAMKHPDFVGLLFVMTIDPSKTTAPFAFINNITGYEGKDEVIFPMHTVFRIRDIQSMGDRLIQVGLTLSNEGDKNLYDLDEQWKANISNNIDGWNCLGQLLIKFQQFERAEEIYNILFRQTNNQKEKENFHQQLAKIREAQKKSKPSGLYSDEIYNPLTSKIDAESIAQGFQARTADAEQESVVFNPFNMQKWQKNIEMLKKKLFVLK